MSNEIVGPYTFGEDYRQIQEKQKKIQFSFNKKKAEVTPEQIQRVNQLTEKYPTALSGLISSAVSSNLSDEEFEKVLALQYKAIGKGNPSLPNPVDNQVVNSLMMNKAYGKVAEATAEGFKSSPWNFKNYTEYSKNALKGISKLIMLAGEALWNPIGRAERAFVETAETYEKPFQLMADLKQQEIEELKNNATSIKPGEPGDTLYNIATKRDEKKKLERTGRIAGLALTFADLLSGRASPTSKATKKTFSEKYKNAGSSIAGTAVEKIKQGEDPQEVFNSFGDGFLLEGPIVKEALENQEAYKYRGRNITIGRYVEDVIGVDPNSVLYGGVSGVIDFAKVLRFDPLLVAGTINKSIKFSNSLSGKLQKAYKEANFEEIPKILNNFLDSEKSAPLIEGIAKNKDFKQLFDAVKDTDLAIKLYNADTPAAVKASLDFWVKTQQSVGIPKVIRSFQSLGYNKNLIKGLKGKNAAYSKFGEWTPEAGAAYADANQSVKVYNQWLVNFQIPRETANNLAYKFGIAANTGNKTLMNKILFESTLDAAKEVAKKKGFKKTDFLDDYFKELSGMGDFNGKSYWAKVQETMGGKYVVGEAEFLGQRTSIPGPGGKALNTATPIDAGQHFDDMWTLGNPMDIRRALGKINKIARLPLNETSGFKGLQEVAAKIPGVKTPVDDILKNIPEKYTDLMMAAPGKKVSGQGLVYGTMDRILWPFQKTWTGVQLITRPAWTLRIFGESQFRMGLDGLDNWIENPMSMFVWGTYTDDLLGNPWKMGTRRGKRAYNPDIEKVIARRLGSVFGKNSQESIIKGQWYPTATQSLNEPSKIQAWQLNLKWPLESDLAQAVAGTILDGTDLTKVKASFWNGKLRSVRNTLNETRIDFKGKRTNPYTKLSDADAYVDSYREWIMDLTNGNPNILKMIRDRKINIDGLDIDLSSIDRFTPTNIKSIKKFLGENIDALPEALPVPSWVSNPAKKNEVFELGRKGSEFLWHWLGELPDSTLQRIPTIKQYYWQQVGQMLPFADDAAIKHFEKGIKAGDIPKSIGELFNASKQNAIKKYGSASKISGKNNSEKINEILLKGIKATGIDDLKPNAINPKTGYPVEHGDLIQAIDEAGDLNKLKELVGGEVALEELLMEITKAQVKFSPRYLKTPKPKDQFGEIVEGVRGAYGINSKELLQKEIQDLLKVKNRNFLSIEDIDEASKAFAIEAHDRLLYNLTQKGYVAEAMRLVYPFLEPWKEIVLNYPRLLAKNLSGLRKVQLATETGIQNGMLFKDPVSNELRYASPTTDLQESVFGIDTPEEIEIRKTASLQGMNLFTQSPLPQFGPVVQVSYQAARRFLPEDWRQAEDVLFPYGLPDSDIGSQISRQLPVYIRNLWNSSTEGGVNEGQFLNDVADAGKILTVAFVKGKLDYDPRTAEGRIQFEEDSIALAQKMNVYENLAKAIEPSSPRLETAVQLESPEFFNDQTLIDTFNELLPEDYSFGKYDDDYFTTTVITAIFREVYNNVDEGEEYLAYALIASLIGEDPNDWDAIYSAAYLVQGKTSSLGAKLPSTEEQVKWDKEWPEHADKYSNTFAYFAPDIEELDLLDVNSFYNQIEEGKRESYTQQELLERAQETAYRVIYNYLTKPYRGDNSKEAIAERATIKENLLEAFPYGTSERDIVKWQKGVSQYEVFLELKEASNDEWLLESSQAAKGLNEFLYGTDKHYGLLAAVDSIRDDEKLIKLNAEGKEIKMNEADALSYLTSRENTQLMRDELLVFLQEIVDRYPEFAPLAKEKFLNYVDYQYTP